VLDITGCSAATGICSSADHEVPRSQEIVALSFVSVSRGWVIGRTQRYEREITAILMTVDGGAHWTEQYRTIDGRSDGREGEG
jgi:photosystem II stability/assembly factor-like uncharacterized protein